MNPLHYGSINCASSSRIEAAEAQEEPKTTAEKIGRHLNKLAQSEQQNHLEQRLWRLEREGAEAIRMLSEEIDILKAKVEELTIKETRL